MKILMLIACLVLVGCSQPGNFFKVQRDAGSSESGEISVSGSFDGDFQTDLTADTAADGDIDGDSDSDVDSDVDSDSDSDGDSDSDTSPKVVDTGGDSDSDSDGDSDSGSDTYSDTDVDTDSDVDSDTDADTGSAPCTEWLDVATDLCWEKNPDVACKSRAIAESYCAGMGAGWRIPTIDELKSISTCPSSTCKVSDSCTDWAECWLGAGDYPCAGACQTRECYWLSGLGGNCLVTRTGSSTLVTNYVYSDWIWAVYYGTGEIAQMPTNHDNNLKHPNWRCVRSM